MKGDLVLQRHARGCAIACVCMLTGLSYDVLWKELFGTMGTTNGLYPNQVVDLLRRYGLEVGDTIYSGRQPGGVLVLEPPPNGAQYYLVSVKVFEDSPCDHYVIQDGFGCIWDPMFGTKPSFRGIPDYRRYQVPPFAAIPINIKPE